MGPSEQRFPVALSHQKASNHLDWLSCLFARSLLETLYESVFLINIILQNLNEVVMITSSILQIQRVDRLLFRGRHCLSDFEQLIFSSEKWWENLLTRNRVSSFPNCVCVCIIEYITYILCHRKKPHLTKNIWRHT